MVVVTGCALTKESSSQEKSSVKLEKTKYPITRRVSQVSCSFYFSIFVSKGNVTVFGKNIMGDELILESLTNIKSASCSNEHCVFLDYEGNVFSVGSNSNGQLGIERDCKYLLSPEQLSLPKIKQIDCGSDFTVCLSEEGKLYSFGSDTYGALGRSLRSKKISSLQNVEFVVCGRNHVVCKTLNNDTFSWGYNDNGQLGLGHLDNQNRPVKCNWPNNIVDIKCGGDHTLVLTDELEVFS